MHKNIISYPDAEDWRELARRSANNPKALLAALLCAASEIETLRRECIRHGLTPIPRHDPMRLGEQWPDAERREGSHIEFRPPSGGPSLV